jgi:Ferritin-like domain
MNKSQGLGRRGFLKGAAGIGGGIAAASFVEAFGLQRSALAADAGDDVQTIVNLAATAETLAVTFYYSALTGATFDLAEDDLVYLRLAMDAEKYHLDFLNSAGGKTLTDKFYVPATVLSDVNVFVKTGLAAETAFIGAYLAATRRFAELGQPRLAATTAQHAVSEGQHLTLIRDIAGLIPNDLGLPAPVYYNVSDAVPTLSPFLTGGAGFIGPVSFPTAAQYTAALKGLKTVRVPTFTQVF